MISGIIVAASFTLLIGLIVIRSYELSVGRVLGLTRGARMFDPLFATLFLVVTKGVRMCARVCMGAIHAYITPFIRRGTLRVYRRMNTALAHAHRRLKGRRNLRNGGSVNFFLHSIGEHKQLSPRRIRTGTAYKD